MDEKLIILLFLVNGFACILGSSDAKGEVQDESLGALIQFVKRLEQVRITEPPIPPWLRPKRQEQVKIPEPKIPPWKKLTKRQEQTKIKEQETPPWQNQIKIEEPEIPPWSRPNKRQE